MEHALLLRAQGDTVQADTQLALADAALALLAANGGVDDLAAAEVALARGQHASAVRLGTQEWRRRQHTDVADLLGWALHRAGRSRDALTYAKRATALGARNASYTFHLAMIETALGDHAAARRDLTQALSINPFFSPVDAPLAARVLAEAGAP